MDRVCRSQSAMEYLMTYGWAILIIAVVLGALYSLGLFNGASLAPRAQPGNCQVYRPNGPVTTAYISLEGSCTNDLPQYVAKFNGQSSYIIDPGPVLPTSNTLTITAWVDPSKTQACSTGTAYCGVAGYGTGGCYANMWLDVQATSPLYAGAAAVCDDINYGTIAISPNVWNFEVIEVNGLSYMIYVNGQSYSGSFTVSPSPSSVNFVIGGHYQGGIADYLNASIADVQIYNTSLDSNSIKALYQEGIGGAPINLQNLAGWWPLNGNANDYSGNINNGQATNVIYTSQWLSGYTTP